MTSLRGVSRSALTLRMGLGWPELVLILVIVLVILGPRKLTSLGEALGRAVRNLRHTANEADRPSDTG